MGAVLSSGLAELMTHEVHEVLLEVGAQSSHINDLFGCSRPSTTRGSILLNRRSDPVLDFSSESEESGFGTSLSVSELDEEATLANTINADIDLKPCAIKEDCLYRSSVSFRPVLGRQSSRSIADFSRGDNREGLSADQIHK